MDEPTTRPKKRDVCNRSSPHTRPSGHGKVALEKGAKLQIKKSKGEAGINAVPGSRRGKRDGYLTYSALGAEVPPANLDHIGVGGRTPRCTPPPPGARYMPSMYRTLHTALSGYIQVIR